MFTGFKKKLYSNEPVVGIWNTIASPVVTEVLALSGLDYVIIDFEHGPFDIKNLGQYINACLVHNCAPLVRIPSNQEWLMLQALDQGAEGIILPHVETKEECQKFVNSLRFYPQGSRGYSPFTKAGRYGATAQETFLSQSNASICAGIIIESLKGLENIESILEVEGLDFIFFGSYDLSQALGVPGQTTSEIVVNAIQKATKVVRKMGKVPGGYLAKNSADLKWAKEQGLNFLVYQVDTHILQQNVMTTMRSFKEL